MRRLTLGVILALTAIMPVVALGATAAEAAPPCHQNCPPPPGHSNPFIHCTIPVGPPPAGMGRGFNCTFGFRHFGF